MATNSHIDLDTPSNINHLDFDIPSNIAEGDFFGKEINGFRNITNRIKYFISSLHARVILARNYTVIKDVTDTSKIARYALKGGSIKDSREAITADFVREIKQQTNVRRYETDLMDTRYKLSSRDVVRYPILNRKIETSFCKFESNLNDLRKSVEINVNAGSTFRYNRPQQFEFNYLVGADNNHYHYGVASKPLTKEIYELFSAISPNVYPKIKGGSVFNVDSGKDEEYRNISEGTKFSPSATERFFLAAWMSEKNDFFNCPAHDWVEFPIGHTLENYLGTDQAKLIRDSPEFAQNLNLFRKLNDGDLTDLLNQHIPGSAGPSLMAQPLSRMPKSVIYNMEHHGSLQIDLARGQRQQYDVQSATGKKFVIGPTSTYYTHDRSVVNLRTSAETHDVFKMYVHSGAAYHFACKAQLPNDFGTRPNTRSEVSYRYEGDFRIEQVTVQDPTNKTEYKGLVDQYIQGIHASLVHNKQPSPNLTIRSPYLRLTSEDPSRYGASMGIPHSGIELVPDSVTISAQPSDVAFHYKSINSKNLRMDHAIINLVGEVFVDGVSRFYKDVGIRPGAKLSCTDIQNLNRLNGRNISISTGSLIIT